MYACQPGASIATSGQLAASGLRSGHPVLPYNQPGMGLFDAGLFNPSGWGLTEWLIVGGGAFLALGGMKLFSSRGSSTARRRRMRIARAQYELEAAKA